MVSHSWDAIGTTGFRVQGLGFRVQGLGFRVSGLLGFGISGFGGWGGGGKGILFCTYSDPFMTHLWVTQRSRLTRHARRALDAA